MTPSDDELLRRMRQGDDEAFLALYRRRQGGVFRFAFHMCGSETIAEDVTQEVFMALVRDSSHYDSSRGSLAGYLFGIARNHVLRHFQRDHVYLPIADENEDEYTQTLPHMIAEGDPLADLTRSELIESVRVSILALPHHYREVVVLCELQEMTYTEAAAAIGCAVGTVRSRLHRARALLSDKLRENKLTDPVSDSLGPARCFA
jgi:RNA polymerase sigma-70 factor (ECF subfamily)